MFSILRRSALTDSFCRGLLDVSSSVPCIQTSSDLLVHANGRMVLIDLRRGPALGKGRCGAVHSIAGTDDRGSTVCVAKLIRDKGRSAGNTLSAYRSEYVEYLIGKLLWAAVVAPGHSPHVVMTIATRYVSECTTRFIFMEHANGGTVARYMEELCDIGCSDAALEEMLLRILFQVVYTMGCIFVIYPDFRHNDLKLDNVLIHNSTPSGMSRYITYNWRGSGFRLLDVGCSVAIGDFDAACIRNVADSYKVTELALEQPGANINTQQDHGSDVFFFLRMLLAFAPKSRLSERTARIIDHLWGYKALNTPWRPTRADVTSLPVPHDILTSGLFDAFASREPTQAMFTSPHCAVPRPFAAGVHPGVMDVRVVPLFERVYPDVSFRLSPSMQYFYGLHSTWKDDATSDVGDAMGAVAILGLMHTPDMRYVFPAGQKSAVVKRARARAANFVASHRVPSSPRWHNVITWCAVVDAVIDFAASDPADKYPAIESYADAFDCTDTQLLQSRLQWTCMGRGRLVYK